MRETPDNIFRRNDRRNGRGSGGAVLVSKTGEKHRMRRLGRGTRGYSRADATRVRASQSRRSRSPFGLDVDATGSSPLTGVVRHLRTFKHLGNDVRRHAEVGCGEPFDGGPKLDEARTVGLLKHPEGADDGEPAFRAAFRPARSSIRMNSADSSRARAMASRSPRSNEVISHGAATVC